MPQTFEKDAAHLRPPMFATMERQPLRPAIVLLAIFVAMSALASIAFGLRHGARAHLHDGRGGGTRSSAAAGGSDAGDDADDDPSQVDTVVLGDAADAPEPARRHGHGGSVHATILIRLPRFGPQEGLIPNSPAGHLLYGWLAAFNQANAAGMGGLLPSAKSASTGAQMELRRRTGGYRLLSAKEIAPGLLVFRLGDQTPENNEALGTLVMRPDSNPATILSFSLRGVPAPAGDGQGAR